MSVPMSALLGLLFGAGIVGLVHALVQREQPAQVDVSRLRPHDYEEQEKGIKIDPTRATVAAIVGLMVAVVSTWPVFGIAFGLGTYAAPTVFAGDGFKDHVGRTDAIATWIESLRNAMSSARSVEGALRDTALAAPEAIAEELHAFVDEVDHGVLMTDALVNLSDRLDHAVSDTALAALVMALSEGATGVRSVLNQVAATCRRMAADSNEVYASRASSRATVRMIIGVVTFSTLFFVIVFSDYLSPYSTPAGQLVLGLVLVWFGMCGAWIVSLAKYRPAKRMIRPGRLVGAP